MHSLEVSGRDVTGVERSREGAVEGEREVASVRERASARERAREGAEGIAGVCGRGERQGERIWTRRLWAGKISEGNRTQRDGMGGISSSIVLLLLGCSSSQVLP
eukprot:1462321-Pleurochrysis_carterae.AAC.1